MTREEAIAELNVLHERLSNPKDCEDGCFSWEDGWYVEAIDMAIEALSADAVGYETTATINEPIIIQSNYVYVVRCKDCRHYEDGMVGYCWEVDRGVSGDFFCAYGERRKP